MRKIWKEKWGATLYESHPINTHESYAKSLRGGLLGKIVARHFKGSFIATASTP